MFIIAKIRLQNIVGHRVHFIGIWGAIAERVWRCYGARERSLVGEAAIAPSSGLGWESSRAAARSSSRLWVSARFCVGREKGKSDELIKKRGAIAWRD
jgi:hypothetical protein